VGARLPRRHLPVGGVARRYTPRQTSKLFAADGRFVAEIGNERRTLATIKDIPPVVREAFLVTEDKRFYGHGGIDWRRVPGAVLRNVRARRWKEGFSTVTMQLARNVFTSDISREKSLVRKLREAKVAREIERRYPKDKILELYLNQIYLGAGAYGVETAAQRYFGKSVRDVNLAEAATLAALPKGPERYNPRRFPDRAVQRRNTGGRADAPRGRGERRRRLARQGVPAAARQPPGERRAGALLRRVGAAAHRAEVRAAALRGRPQGLHHARPRHAVGRRARARGAAPRGRGGALRAVQARHLRAVRRGLGRRGERARGRVEPVPAGRVRRARPAHRRGARPRRRARLRRQQVQPRHAGAAAAGVELQARGLRGAVQNGRMPSSLVNDAAGDHRRLEPEELRRQVHGPDADAPRALPVAQPRDGALGQELGPQAVVAEARKFGITTPIPNYPSIYLGAASVYPIEMVAAYSAFATLGTRAAPYAIVRVEDRDGRVLWEPEPVRAPVLSPEEAYLMVSMMKDVNLRGTAYGAVGARASACPRPARRAPPTTAPTRGTSATRPTSWPACGSGWTGRAPSRGTRRAASSPRRRGRRS
jgi:penicillin-binding protein 1A